MPSNFRPEASKNSGDNVFRQIAVGKQEPELFARFLSAHDLSPNSRRAFVNDIRKLPAGSPRRIKNRW